MKAYCITSNIAFDCLHEDSKVKLIDGKEIDYDMDWLEYLFIMERMQ